MAEQPNNLEMFDVLASIRRLVSEERKAAPPRIEPVPPALPQPESVADGEAAAPVANAVATPMPDEPVNAASAQSRYKGLPLESRFVLTAALRVGEEGGAADTHKAWDEDARQDTQDKGADAEGGTPPAPPVNDSDDIDRRTASLEETIAELEAAVADIGSEFEPDGGESGDLVTELFPETNAEGAANEHSPRSDQPIRRSGFQGIMAGFEDMSPPDEVLDAPVTGDALIPPVGFTRAASAPASGRAHSPFGRSWSANDKDKRDEPASDLPNAANVTFVHAPVAPAPVVEPGAAPVDDDLAKDPATDEAPDDPQDLATGDDAPATADAGAAEASDGDDLDAADADDHASDAAENGQDDMDNDSDPAEGAPADMADESLAGHSAGTDEDQEESLTEPEVSVQRVGRPQIVRSPAPVADTADEGRDLGGALAADDPSEDDEPDLFNPLASVDLDMQAMRDIVAELVREELRGVLGERITRNLRALVRNEIRKALSDTGPSQG